MVSVSLTPEDPSAETGEESDEAFAKSEEADADADEELLDDEHPASPAMASAPVMPMKLLLDITLYAMLAPSAISQMVLQYRNT
jgi:hypothetical protein